MAEVTLKKKVTLRRKEEQAAFTFTGKLKVKLFLAVCFQMSIAERKVI